MAHVPQEELLNKLDAAVTDSVRMFDSEDMTVGLKRYRKGAANEKGTREHAKDELYYVLNGAGTMTVGEDTHSVAEGDLLFVGQGESHDIVEVESQLTVLKIFSG